MDLVIFSSVQVRDEKIDGAFGVRSMFLLARINEDHNYKTRGHKTMTIYLERESAFTVVFCWLVSVGIHKNTHTHTHTHTHIYIYIYIYNLRDNNLNNFIFLKHEKQRHVSQSSSVLSQDNNQAPPFNKTIVYFLDSLLCREISGHFGVHCTNMNNVVV
jgi:hypothetical protein